MKAFPQFIFADHQDEYIVSLRHYFFEVDISWLTNVQRNLQNLRPSKITTYTVVLL